MQDTTDTTDTTTSYNMLVTPTTEILKSLYRENILLLATNYECKIYMIKQGVGARFYALQELPSTNNTKKIYYPPFTSTSEWIANAGGTFVFLEKNEDTFRILSSEHSPFYISGIVITNFDNVEECPISYHDFINMYNIFVEDKFYKV